MSFVNNEAKISCFQNISSKVKEGCYQHRKAITTTIICCLILMALVALGLFISSAVISMPSLLTVGLFLLAVAFVGMAIVAIKLASKIKIKLEIDFPVNSYSDVGAKKTNNKGLDG